MKRQAIIFSVVLLLVLALCPDGSSQASLAPNAAEWTVSVTINELHDLDDNDAEGAYDFYRHVVFSSEPLNPCDNEEEFIEGYDIYPGWGCARELSGDNPSVSVRIWKKPRL